MAWVTWRQHRLQLLVLFGVLLLVAAAALVTSLPVRAAYHARALSSCLPPSTRAGCDLIVSHFRSEFAPRVDAARYLIFLPALAGLFVGAPLTAREFEHGTFRLAWTQGISRGRWLLSKTSLLGLVTFTAAAALAGMTMWWRQPFDQLGGRMSPLDFDIEGLVVPAYALFALAVGILAGLLLRRALPAMALATAVFIGVRLGVEKLLRPRYLPPLHRATTGLDAGAGAHEWVLSNSVVDAVGRTVSTGGMDHAILHAQRGGIDPHSYLLGLGWRRVITYQPEGRFWTFQGIEFGIFLLLALAAVAASVVLVRRAQV